MEIKEYTDGVINGNKSILARAITLVESSSKAHRRKAQEVLQKLIPHSGKSVRIGITGSPGAGKSTFIEAFGSYLCETGHKVAVLAIDPSSTLTGGSILGDKTRMEKLARHDNSYIRPSPSGGTLGGVASKTRESMIVCEAAGFDVILVETVGIGQSETKVRSMVDFFLLLLLPGSGDELQGIKKGSVELADALVINKADGANKELADRTKNAYEQALHLLMPVTEGWYPKVLTASSVEGSGIDDVWKLINEYTAFANDRGIFQKRRNEQMIDWLHSMIEERLKKMFYENETVSDSLNEVKESILDGLMTPAQAMEDLMDKFNKSKQ